MPKEIWKDKNVKQWEDIQTWDDFFSYTEPITAPDLVEITNDVKPSNEFETPYCVEGEFKDSSSDYGFNIRNHVQTYDLSNGQVLVLQSAFKGYGIYDKKNIIDDEVNVTLYDDKGEHIGNCKVGLSDGKFEMSNNIPFKLWKKSLTDIQEKATEIYQKEHPLRFPDLFSSLSYNKENTVVSNGYSNNDDKIDSKVMYKKYGGGIWHTDVPIKNRRYTRYYDDFYVECFDSIDKGNKRIGDDHYFVYIDVPGSEINEYYGYKCDKETNNVLEKCVGRNGPNGYEYERSVPDDEKTIQDVFKKFHLEDKLKKPSNQNTIINNNNSNNFNKTNYNIINNNANSKENNDYAKYKGVLNQVFGLFKVSSKAGNKVHQCGGNYLAVPIIKKRKNGQSVAGWIYGQAGVSGKQCSYVVFNEEPNRVYVIGNGFDFSQVRSTAQVDYDAVFNICWNPNREDVVQIFRKRNSPSDLEKVTRRDKSGIQYTDYYNQNGKVEKKEQSIKVTEGNVGGYAIRGSYTPPNGPVQFEKIYLNTRRLKTEPLSVECPASNLSATLLQLKSSELYKINSGAGKNIIDVLNKKDPNLLNKFNYNVEKNKFYPVNK